MVSSNREQAAAQMGARYRRALALLDRRQQIGETLPRGEDVVATLRLIHADEDMMIAALLADRRLREVLSEAEIAAGFGEPVASLVRNVRTLNALPGCVADERKSEEQAERLRRLLLALVDDVRAVLIKLAYRLERLRLLASASYEDRRCVARETLEIYSPLANRLGVSQLKWELEDLAFRYLDPISYKRIAKGLEARRSEREAYVEQFRDELQALLRAAGIEARISGRPKHIYSIWKKMRRKGVGLDELFDILALRVIVDDVSQCYATLGIVHTHWQTIPKEFDDYIANPKPNGYQSLHTVVIGQGGKPVEIQIRTRRMDEFAEQGVAAHWMYKEGGSRDESLQKVVNSLRGLLDAHRDADEELLEDFRTEIYANRVFVFTPRGEVVELPRGATPLDFAYAIHTEVGHRCRGAKVNGRIVPLTSKLETGDHVEILTAREPSPNRNWMDPRSGYLISPGARAKVRAWFHKQDSAQNEEAGRKILEQTARRLGVETPPLEVLLEQFHCKDEKMLFVAIGRGDIRQGQLDTLLLSEGEAADAVTLPLTGQIPEESDDRARVAGVGNLLTKVARCCNPIPGDDVIGYITQGQGVSIHRSDCRNIVNLPAEKRDRLIEIEWGGQARMHTVALEIKAYDRPGLLNEVTRLLLETKSNVLRADTRTDLKTMMVTMNLTIQVKGAAELTRLISRLSQLRSVTDVHRVGGGR